MAIAEGARITLDVARQAARRSGWDHRAAVSFATLAALVTALTALAYVRGAWGYVDNGDGYYLYAARRVAEGATLYRDLLGTQPPLVYLLGALAFKLGASLDAMRLLSAAMRALAVGLVFLLGRRLFASSAVASLAALLYALLPIGLAWDRSFDVNPPLTLVALLGAVVVSRLTPPSARLAGLLAALALFTKNLYLPLLATTLGYLLLRRRPLLAPYLQGLCAGAGIFGAILVAYAGPAGLRDAFLGQDASPANGAWFAASLYYVVTQEGALLLAALIGLYLLVRQGEGLSHSGRFRLWRGERLRRSPLRKRGIAEGCALRASRSREKRAPKSEIIRGIDDSPVRRGVLHTPAPATRAYAPLPLRGNPPLRTPRRDNDMPLGEGRREGLPAAHDYTPYLFAGSAAVLLATIKEGTFGTVFQFAEPAVALLAAYALVALARQAWQLAIMPALAGRERRHQCQRDAGAPRKGLLALALLACIAWASLGILRTDTGTLASYGNAGNADQVRRVAAIVRAHARPGSAVLLPPYYALLTGTRLPFDAADTYIVAQRAQRGDPVASGWMQAMARAVAGRRYPVVVTDDRIAAYAPVMAALRSSYHVVYADTLPPALHAVVWLPN